MGLKRKTYTLRKGDIIEVEEFHDGNYGSPGNSRQKKRKPTAEQMAAVNRINKAKRCRHRLLEYFDQGDLFATLTYEVANRPTDMKAAKKDLSDALRYIRKCYKQQDRILRWIANIEQGTKGAWHIHLVIKEIGDTASILKKAWKKGGIYAVELRRSSKFCDEDMSQLADYMTKDEMSRERKNDGEEAKPRIRQSSYSTSRNMPLKEPKVEKGIRWKSVPHVKKGYYLAKAFEGINPVTGFMYRRYTMIRLESLNLKRESKRRC